jgi:hypothetical protein
VVSGPLSGKEGRDRDTAARASYGFSGINTQNNVASRDVVILRVDILHEFCRDAVVSAEQHIKQTTKQPIYIAGERGTPPDQVTDSVPKIGVAAFGDVGLTTVFLTRMMSRRHNQVRVDKVPIRVNRLGRVAGGNRGQHQSTGLFIPSSKGKR